MTLLTNAKKEDILYLLKFVNSPCKIKILKEFPNAYI